MSTETNHNTAQTQFVTVVLRAEHLRQQFEGLMTSLTDPGSIRRAKARS